MACLLPGVIAAVVLFGHQYQVGRADFEKDTIRTARALVQTVDVQLIKAQLVAQALSTSSFLATQDFAGFHRRALELLQKADLGGNVVLTDKSGQQIVNTLRPFGESLPRHGDPEQVRRVFATGRTNISDLHIGGVSGRPVISVDVPVLSNGQVVYDLSVGILPEQLSDILSVQHLPPDWVVGVFDRTGTAAARTHAPEQFVGQKGSSELVQRMLAVPEGTVEIVTREGIPTLTFYSRSPTTNWSVAIGIPRQSLESERMRTVALLGLGIAILFGVGIGLAWYMGGRIARSVNALTAPAIALEAGEAVAASQVHFREADAVAQAMARTAQLLKQRTQALHESLATLQEREAELAKAQRIAQLGSWHWDARTDAVEGSEELHRLSGRAVIPPFAEQMDTIYPRAAWQQLNAAIQEAVRTGIGYDLELPARRGDGSAMWVNARSEAVRNASGEVVGLRGTVQDITERKQAQSAQRLAALLFANIQDGAVVTDPSGTILAINPAFTAITGYTEAEILGQNMRRLQSGRHDADFYQQMWHTILTTGGWQGEIWNQRNNGEIYLERLSIKAVYDQSGKVVNYIGTSSDLTRLKHADHMEYQAHHDVLTGLPNRLLLVSLLEHALEASKRHHSQVAVLYFDLDHFKAVNDTLGHTAGDELLQKVALRLVAHVRDMDTLARLGGDEFVAVLEDVEGPEGAAKVAREFVRLLQQPFIMASGQEARIGGSVGIAMFPADGDSAEILLQHADAALYRAKAAGRNTYRFHSV
jgi:diguanylate cyclase (GGDEF)-like protein/PAS domain S-box-containing protein